MMLIVFLKLIDLDILWENKKLVEMICFDVLEFKCVILFFFFLR